MHHQHPELDAMHASDRYQSALREAEAARLAALARGPRRMYVREAARMLGRALVGAGAALMRYGKSSELVVLPGPGSDGRGIQLN